jgi:hypothetical protein
LSVKKEQKAHQLGGGADVYFAIRTIFEIHADETMNPRKSRAFS